MAWAAGLAGALASGRWISALLFGVTPADPATLAIVVCALAGAAACYTKRRANQQWPGWDADILSIQQEALVSNARARAYEGLRMKEPSQYLDDPLLRARKYLQKFSAPPAWTH